jgi:hypothetical protein
MFRFPLLWLGAIFRLFRSRRDLLVENLALRQQFSVFKRRNRRPKLGVLDKLFWVLARRFWSDWKESLLVVAPETVVRWHRAGFRVYWRLVSKVKKRVGRKRLSKELRDLIFRMVAENPTWGAPHPRRTAHARLRRIGTKHLALDEASAAQRSRTRPALVDLPLQSSRDHCHGLFHGPTVTFQLLYC